MEEIYSTISGFVDLWELPTESNNDSIEATEFWLHHATNQVKVKPRTIPPTQRDAWLDERKTGDGDEAQTLVARFVLLVADKQKNQISLSPTVQRILLDRFGLGLAYRYFRTFYSGVTTLPPVDRPGLNQQAYAFCYGPKLAAIWSRSILTSGSINETVLEGMIFSRAHPSPEPGRMPHGQSPAEELQVFLKTMPCNPDICRSSAFPAYLFSLLLGRQMNNMQAKIAASLRKVESRTGYHGFSRFGEGYQDELAKLSADASGYAGKLSGVKRKAHVVEQLLDCITQTVEKDAQLPATILSDRGAEIMKANVDILRGRLNMQRVDVENTLKRVEIQIEALFHLISQEDTINNYQLALWTRDISLTSQRDAASMKTLAVVTMFFLPGSFISALFSTQMFVWDDVDKNQTGSIGVPVTPQFKLYWAVTIPLTLVTFLLYVLWLLFQAKRRDGLQLEREKMDQLKLREALKESSGKEAEKLRLAKRKITLSQKEGLDV